MSVAFIQEADFQILDWIRRYLRCDALDWLMPKISFLGNAGILWIILAVALLCTKKYRERGLSMAYGLIAQLLICNLFLKNLIARSRPCWIRPEIALLVKVPQDYSFPSGHSMVSFIAATVLWHYDRRWGAAAYVLAVLIGFSRLYLYVHFPTDVLCGAVLGILVGAAVMYVVRRRGAAHESDGDLPPAKA